MRRVSARPEVVAGQLLIIMALIASCLSLARVLGFAEGDFYGVAWVSGLALAAMLHLRLPGLIGSGIALFCTEVAWGMPPDTTALLASKMVIAVLAAAITMRHLARRYVSMTNTQAWLVLFTGICVLTILTTVLRLLIGLWEGVSLQLLVNQAMINLIAEPLGVASILAISGRLDEARSLLRHAPMVGAAALTTALLVGSVEMLLRFADQGEAHSTIILLIAIPLSIWFSLLPHALGPSIVALIGFNASLWFVKLHLGTIYHPDYTLVLAGYLVLVLSFQLVHCVNRDRLEAMNMVAAHNEQLESEVSKRTATLETMTCRAIAADKAKSDFLATISHELRTPLNGILGMADLLVATSQNPEKRAHVEVIHASGMKLLHLIDSLLNATNLSKNEKDLPKLNFDPSAMLVSLVEEAKEGQNPKSLVLLADIDPEIPNTLSGSASEIREILRNLIDNAVKFTPRGKIKVMAHLIGKTDNEYQIEFSVKDTGIGIPVDQQTEIFNPFVQVESNETRSFGGAGLGLAVSAMLARSVKSEIVVESSPGNGARFSFKVWLGVASRQDYIAA